MGETDIKRFIVSSSLLSVNQTFPLHIRWESVNVDTRSLLSRALHRLDNSRFIRYYTRHRDGIH
jgi:hypothetical protein